MFFLLSWQLLIWDIHRFSLFLEITGVLKGSRSFKISFESSVHVWKLALHAGVPMILDCVIGATFENFSNLSPFIVDDSMHKEQYPFFLLAPGNFLDHRIQVVVPAFTALLSNAIW